MIAIPVLGSKKMVKSEFDSSGGVVNGSHCSTVERLYAWEKKLFEEVKVKLRPFVFFLHVLMCLKIQESNVVNVFVFSGQRGLRWITRRKWRG